MAVLKIALIGNLGQNNPFCTKFNPDCTKENPYCTNQVCDGMQMFALLFI